MKKIFKSRPFIITVCLALAGIIAFVMLPGVYAGREATTTVLSAAENIPAGTKIEASHIKEVEVGAFGLPKDIVTDKSLLIGQYTAAGIHRDSYFFADEIGETRQNERILETLNSNIRLVTVTVPSMAAGLSSHMRAGDIVSVVCFVEEREEERNVELSEGSGMVETVVIPAHTIVYPELSAVMIFDVENARTQSVDDVKEQQSEAGGDGTDRNTYDPIPKTVTFAVNDEQALKLIEAEYSGQIHLVLVERPTGGE